MSRREEKGKIHKPLGRSFNGHFIHCKTTTTTTTTTTLYAAYLDVEYIRTSSTMSFGQQDALSYSLLFILIQVFQQQCSWKTLGCSGIFGSQFVQPDGCISNRIPCVAAYTHQTRYGALCRRPRDYIQIFWSDYIVDDGGNFSRVSCTAGWQHTVS